MGSLISTFIFLIAILIILVMLFLARSKSKPETYILSNNYITDQGFYSPYIEMTNDQFIEKLKDTDLEIEILKEERPDEIYSEDPVYTSPTEAASEFIKEINSKLDTRFVLLNFMEISSNSLADAEDEAKADAEDESQGKPWEGILYQAKKNYGFHIEYNQTTKNSETFG